jgi:ribulose-bisphosphate carboxylase large chain
VGGQAAEMHAQLGRIDLMHLAGGGIIGHPQGIAAGVRSMREGWEAAMAVVPMAEYARTHPALAAALGQFGQRA